MLEPWLGTGLALDELPVPRIIVVRLAPGRNADLAQLQAALKAQVAGASLDDCFGAMKCTLWCMALYFASCKPPGRLGIRLC